MKHQYFFYYYLYTLKNATKFFCPKNHKTRRVKPLRTSLWFSRMVEWWTWFRENQSSDTKIKNMLINYIVLAFGWRSIFFFFFGDEKKIPQFFTAILGPKLHVIIINNYRTKHNIDKIYVNRKTPVLRISVLNFKSIR